MRKKWGRGRRGRSRKGAGVADAAAVGGASGDAVRVGEVVDLRSAILGV